MLVGSLITAAATALLLRAEYSVPAQRRIWKPLASVGFLIAVAGADLDAPYARFIAAGLLLSALGDIALLSDTQTRFLVGLSLFLAAHLAYIGGFRSLEVTPGVGVIGLVSLVFVGISIWLLPQVPGALRIPVLGYITTIGVMLSLALVSGSIRAALGAAAFAISDIAVARNAFGAPSFSNKAWGLPLYYGGQLLIVASVFTLGG